MRSAISSGLTTTELQTARVTNTLTINSRNREYLRTDHELLGLRVQNFKDELEKENHRLASGQSTPAELVAYLEREYVLLLEDIKQTDTQTRQYILCSADHSTATKDGSPIGHYSSYSSTYHNYKHEGVTSTNTTTFQVHAPTPRLFQPTVMTGSDARQDIDCEPNNSPYLVREAHSQPRAATTHPISFTSSPLSPPLRTGSVSNFPYNRSLIGANQKQENSSFRTYQQGQSRPPSRRFRAPSRSRSRPSFPPLPPIKVADVQATYANGVGERSDSPDKNYFEDFPFPPSRAVSPSSVPDVESAQCPVNDCFSWPVRPGTPTPLSPPNLDAHESGRRSARGWHNTTPRPEAKDTLHRFVLSKTQNEKVHHILDEKLEFKVCTEDDDDNVTLVHDITLTDGLPTINPTSVVDNRGATPVPLRSSSNLPQRVHHLDFIPRDPSAPFMMPPLEPASPALDEFVISSATAYAISSTTKVTGNFGVAQQITNICTDLVDVFRDLTRYKVFLSHRGADAQYLLDFIQTLLDSPRLEEPFRIILFVALVRLSRKSELYPRCFTLSNVTRGEEYPVTDGHFGEIFKGHFRGRAVCLKVVKMYCNSDQAHLYKAFSREAVIWGQLSHINVLPFYGTFRLGDSRNRIGLVSPWMRNGNINEFIGKNPETNRRLLVSDVAAGMSYLHKNGVVHGDLKGANILVSDSGRACLADFGLSSVMDAQGLKDPDLSSNNAEGGTVRFQAPELIDPDPALESPRSPNSDVYAFGMVCYEIFTGEPPFIEVKHVYTVMLKVGSKERPSRPLGTIHSTRGLTDLMWRLMEDCWDHNPANRPNAAQIVRRLPQAGIDRRSFGGWGDLSPLKFRATDRFGGPDGHDASVANALRNLEVNGICISRF